MKLKNKRFLSVLTATAMLCCLLFPASAGDAALQHEHTFIETIVVSPGYVSGGLAEYRCACGESYTEPISPLSQPIGIMESGRVAPGESITLQARLLNCSHLRDLALDLIYNTQVLQLTHAECVEFGAPRQDSPTLLYFGSIPSAAQEAVLTLVFTANADAPAGMQTVYLSGCGVSDCAADEEEQISLTAPAAKVEIFRPAVLTVTAPTEPVYTGDTVQMTVDIQDNPGIAGMTFELHYDPDVLVLTDVQQCGMLASGSMVTSGSLSMLPFRVLWDDATATENHTENGSILTLTFTVRQTAQAGTTAVFVSIDQDSVMDVQLQSVELLTRGASLLILTRLPGDTDGDGAVDLADVVCLSRYLAQGWSVSVEPRNSDVNGDGVLDLKDVVLIRRYLAGGWNIELI